MSSGRSIAASALLLALLTGCGLRPHREAPAVAAQAPSLPPSQMASLIPLVPPPLPVVWERPIKLDTTVPPEPKPEVAAAPPHRSPRHHARSGGQETAQLEPKAPGPAAAEPPAQQNEQATAAATTAQPSENSPIGQLSTDNGNSNIADRNEIGKEIDDTENAVNAIKRPLDAEEQKTVVQIRTYIVRAREALKNDDLDGARNTFTKAHLLLLELTSK